MTWNLYLITLILNFILMFIFSIISIQFSEKIYTNLNPSKPLRLILCLTGAMFTSFANLNADIALFYLVIGISFIIAYLFLLGPKQFSLNIFLANAYMLNIMTVRMCIACILALLTEQSLFDVSYQNPFLAELSIIITLILLISAMLFMIKIIPGNLVYRITQISALRRAMNIWMGLSNVYLLSQSLGYTALDSTGISIFKNYISISILLLFANWAFLFYNVRIIRLLDLEHENHKMHEKMEELNYAATIDGLTGLLNKTSAIEAINTMIPSGGALFVIDIDNFKLVNDTQGHTNGDILLHQVALEIKKQFRGDDILGRFGGDEFIVFMPNSTLSYSLLEKKASELCRCTQKAVGTSISVGVLFIPQERLLTFEEAFPLADHALYESKKKEKNTYTIHML